MEMLSKGENVLILWESGDRSENLKEFVEKCKNIIGDTGKVSVEHAQRLSMASFPGSTFDVVLSGLYPQAVAHNLSLLGEVVRVVRPQGHVVLQEAVGEGGSINTREKLLSLVKISGLSQPSSAEPVPLPPDQLQKLAERVGGKDVILLEVRSSKPDYEVGSSSKLSFANTAKQPVDVAAVWKLDDTVDEDIETIDPDDLLDDDDLKKPDPASLRVCGTTGKRKACKNCSCGLAEELAASSKPVQKTATSSCGNCYLGDAFRCASCPYLGMPAFKPGEKILLTDRQLKADV